MNGKSSTHNSDPSNPQEPETKPQKSLYRFRHTSLFGSSFEPFPEANDSSDPLLYRFSPANRSSDQPTATESESSQILTYRLSALKRDRNPVQSIQPNTAFGSEINHAPKGFLVLFLLVLPFLLLLGISLILGVQSPDTALIGRTRSNTPGQADFDYGLIVQRADELVDRNELKMALSLLNHIPGASQKRQEIAAELVQRARSAYPAKLETAIYMLSNVPAETPAYQDARSLLAQWQPQLDQIRTVEFAISQQQWQTASDQLQSLRGTAIEQTDRFRQLSEQITKGK